MEQFCPGGATNVHSPTAVVLFQGRFALGFLVLILANLLGKVVFQELAFLVHSYERNVR